MVVQCPQCETGHLFDERAVRDLTQLGVQCANFQTSFVARCPSLESTRAGKAPANPERNENITVTAERTKHSADQRVFLLVRQGLMKGEVFRPTKSAVTMGRIGADIE